MMPRRNALLLATMICIGLSAAVPSVEAAGRGAMIVSPKRNREVKYEQEVIGKLHVGGQPLVFVRSENGDGNWWLQPRPEMRERGYFRTTVRFGTRDAKKGDRFDLVVLVVRNGFEADFFRDQHVLPELPKSMVRSEAIPVVLGEDALEEASEDRGPAAVASTILKPRQDESVSRIADLLGRVREGKTPVVLVRVDDVGGLWWVQDPVQLGRGGYFKARVLFGNNSTPNGTKFQIVVATPQSGREAVHFKPGSALAEIPEGVPVSNVVTVELDRRGRKNAGGAE